MSLPDGSMVLLCQVGPEYSQVSDADFDLWNTNAYTHVEEISAELFALWFSNIKKVSTLYTISSTDEEVEFPPPFASTGIQWRIDTDTFLPVEPNTSDHPFPRTLFDGGYLNTPAFMPVYMDYLNEDYLDDPEAAYYTGMPLFFIHRDKFYFRADLPYPYLSGEMSYTVTLTDTAFILIANETHGGGIVETRNYTITIEETFYP